MQQQWWTLNLFHTSGMFMPFLFQVFYLITKVKYIQRYSNIIITSAAS